MKEMKKEPIDNSRIELTEKIHEELRVSLELERKLLRKELAKWEKKIKELTEQLQKENNGRKVTKWNQQP